MRVNLYTDILIDAAVTPRSIRRQTWTPNVSIGAPCCTECRPAVHCFRAITAVRPSSTTVTDYHTALCFVSRSWDIMVALKAERLRSGDLLQRCLLYYIRP